MKTAMFYAAMLIGMCCIHERAYAQTQVNFGTKIGTTYSTFYGTDVEKADPRSSLSGGLFLTIRSGRLLSLQPEFLLVQKGAVNYYPNFNIKEDFRINYFEVPVLFKLNIPLGRVLYPNIFIGPYYAHKLSNTYTVSQLNEGISYQTNNLNFRTEDVGVVAGGGLEIQGRFLCLMLDARYGWGLTTIDQGGNYYTRDIRNGYFTVSVGLGVRIY